MVTNEIEINHEIEMTKEKLLEIISKLDKAEEYTLPGQVVRVKLHHSFCLVFRNLNRVKSTKAVSFETESTQRILS